MYMGQSFANPFLNLLDFSIVVVMAIMCVHVRAYSRTRNRTDQRNGQHLILYHREVTASKIGAILTLKLPSGVFADPGRLLTSATAKLS